MPPVSLYEISFSRLMKPPRPDSACARPDTPPIQYLAGGEITPPEIAEFQNENENENEKNSLVPSPPFYAHNL